MAEAYFLTPTGGRPEGLALLGEYIEAQTFKGDATWIVVDDCDPATHVPRTRFRTEVIRPDWRWAPGENTQARSLIAGLQQIPTSAVVFILEDDDCYLPGYVDAMLQGLKGADMVGESAARYYNVRTGRYREIGTRHHSSLASTAVRGTAPLIEACRKRPKFIDLHLWRSFRGRKTWLDSRNVVGIKGLPGRGGIGVGHRHRFGSPDTRGVLRAWCGDYAENYGVFRA